MRHACLRLGAVILAVLGGGMAVAGEHCRACRGAACGAHATYGGTGCGPRVWGPCHEPVGPIDPCDACARFRGCHGERQAPEWLAPWQLPPNRGFRPPEAFGYRTAPCAACAGCGLCRGWRVHW